MQSVKGNELDAWRHFCSNERPMKLVLSWGAIFKES